MDHKQTAGSAVQFRLLRSGCGVCALVFGTGTANVMVTEALTVAGGQNERAECQTDFPMSGYTYLINCTHTNEQDGFTESKTLKRCQQMLTCI